MKALALLFLSLVLAGCSRGLVINQDHPSQNHDSRAQFVVLHYTSASQQRSLELLTCGEVSAHYLVGDEPATIFKLVDENQRAWHAGDSQWQGRTWLNSSSIGIEIVNPGYRDTPAGRVWYPYSEAQVQAVIALVADIARRHRIEPRNIIGHSDIAPLRKLDPGPLFPWKRLADAGLGVWPKATDVAHQQARFEVNPPSIAWYQQQLTRMGYAVPQTGTLDVTTQRVLAAFQMHFRARLYDGRPDAESAAILYVLNRSNG
jgi:N-acetylmuramoyl-L-alanine amidase